MGKPTIAAKLAIEGEKQYRETVRNVNSDLRQLQAELRKVSAEFADNEDSVEALTAKDKILNEEVEKQKAKIEALKGALKSAASAYGDSDDRTRKYSLSLTAAETDLIKLNRKVDDNRSSLNKAKDSTDDMRVSVDKMGDSADEAGDKTLKMSDIIKANLISAAIINGVKALASAFYDLAKGSIEGADEISKLATQTGFTAEEIQKLQYVGTALDVELETMTGSMSKLIKNMNAANVAGGTTSDTFKTIAPDAAKVEIATLKLAAAQQRLSELQAKGTATASQLTTAQANLRSAQENLKDASTAKVVKVDGEAAKGAALAFEKLGVKIANSDGSLRDSKKVMFEAIDALGKMTNETDRDAMAMQIFGKSAMELNPLIKAGSDRINELTDAAIKNGAVMSNETVEGLDAFNDSIELMGLSIKATVGEIIVSLMPTFNEVIAWIQDHREEIKEFATDAIGKIGDVLKDIFNWVQAHPDDIDNFINSTAQAVGAVATALGTLIGYSGDATKLWDGLAGWGQMAVGMGVLAAGIFGVAIAVGVLQSAWSLGAAMVGIVVGMTMMKNAADKMMKELNLKSSTTIGGGASSVNPSANTSSGASYNAAPQKAFNWAEVTSYHAEGGIFTRPTVLSTPSGYQGFGEAGMEAILPLNRMPSLIGGMFDYDLMADAMIRAQRNSPAIAVMENDYFRSNVHRSILSEV